jgi:hypothetical protein
MAAQKGIGAIEEHAPEKGHEDKYLWSIKDALRRNPKKRRGKNARERATDLGERVLLPTDDGNPPDAVENGIKSKGHKRPNKNSKEVGFHVRVATSKIVDHSQIVKFVSSFVSDEFAVMVRAGLGIVTFYVPILECGKKKWGFAPTGEGKSDV